jgi:hypothetical protein
MLPIRVERGGIAKGRCDHLQRFGRQRSYRVGEFIECDFMLVNRYQERTYCAAFHVTPLQHTYIVTRATPGVGSIATFFYGLRRAWFGRRNDLGPEPQEIDGRAVTLDSMGAAVLPDPIGWRFPP